jgi:hypothetical protein
MLFQAVMKFLSRACLDQNFTQKGKGLLARLSHGPRLILLDQYLDQNFTHKGKGLLANVTLAYEYANFK